MQPNILYNYEVRVDYSIEQLFIVGDNQFNMGPKASSVVTAWNSLSQSIFKSVTCSLSTF